MEHKTVLPEIKDVEGRTVHAVIATLDYPDQQRDTVKDGFFSIHPTPALIVPAHTWTHVHLGKSWSYQRGPEIHTRLLFNQTKAADEWLEAIRFDFQHGEPLQRWSWGFKAHEDAQTRTKSGRDLHARPSGEPGIMLFEVSPVLQAASIGTRTTAIKSHDWSSAMLARIQQRRIAWR